MRTYKLKIVTPDGVIFDDEVQSLLAKSDDGTIEILAGHIDYIASLSIGEARVILADGTRRYGALSGGFLTVGREGVTLLPTTFEWGDMIDLERALAAKERAEEKLNSSKDALALDIARAKLQRALTRIRIYESTNKRY